MGFDAYLERHALRSRQLGRQNLGHGLGEGSVRARHLERCDYRIQQLEQRSNWPVIYRNVLDFPFG